MPILLAQHRVKLDRQYALQCPATNSGQVCVINVETGRIYYDKRGPVEDPASLTKVLTAYIIDRDYADWSATITVQSTEETETGGSELGIAIGDVITIDGMVMGMMVPSGCDCAMSLATKWGEDFGSNPSDPVNDFLNEMYATAATLGLSSDVIFGTPHGGPPVDNRMTAKDCAILAAAAVQRPRIERVMKMATISIDVTGGRTVTLSASHTHDLLSNNATYSEDQREGIFAGKTGTNFKYMLGTFWLSPSNERIAIATTTADSDAERDIDAINIIRQLKRDVPELNVFKFEPSTDISNVIAVIDPTNRGNLFQTDDTSTPVTAIGQSIGRISSPVGSTAAIQATIDSRPSWQTEAGKYYVDFDGNNDYFTFGSGTLGNTSFFATTSDAFTILVAGKQKDAGGNDTVYAKAGAVAGDRNLHLHNVASLADTEPNLTLRGTTTGNHYENATTPFYDFVCAVMWDGVGPVAHLKHTDSPIIDVNWNNCWLKQSVGTSVDEAAENFLIAARTSAAPTAFGNIRLYGLIICDGAMTSAEAIQSMRWLKRRTVDVY